MLNKLELLDDLKDFFIYYYNEFDLLKNHEVLNGTSDLSLSFSKFVFICFIFWFSSLYVGLFLNKNIREFNIDTKIRFFKYSNDWYYYFYAKVLDYPDQKGNSKDVDLFFLDILAKIDNAAPVIYSGILVEYNLDNYGELKNIYLKGAVRQAYHKNRLSSRIVEFPNDYLIIPAHEIININIRYFYNKEKGNGLDVSESKIFKFLLQQIYNLVILYYPLFLVYQLIRAPILLFIWIVKRIH